MEVGQKDNNWTDRKVDNKFWKNILLAWNELRKHKTVTTLQYFKMERTWFNDNIKTNKLPIY